MPRKSIEERLAQIEAQRKTLKARLGKQERTEDTRRKVLLGAPVLHRLEHGNDAFSKNLTACSRLSFPASPPAMSTRHCFDDILIEGKSDV